MIKQYRVEKEIYRMVYYDLFIDLFNRWYVILYLIVVMNCEYILNNSIVVFFLDLNWFKVINDVLGYNVGDQLFQLVGRCLLFVVFDNGFIVCFGGDEFIIILMDVNISIGEVDVLVRKII